MRRLEKSEVAAALLSLSGAATQEHLAVHHWVKVLTNASSRSVGHRLRQALLHPLPGPVAVFKISSNVSSLGPAGWVEDQDVRGGSSDCSVSRTSAAPASKSKKKAARRPASRVTQAKQVKGSCTWQGSQCRRGSPPPPPPQIQARG